MIKNSEGMVVVYWICGSAGVCPSCGNHNAMLDTVRRDGIGNRYEDLECRDCGYYCYEGLYVNVTITMDSRNRVYLGVAADGTTVELAPFDDEYCRPSHKPLMAYLAKNPTPAEW